MNEGKPIIKTVEDLGETKAKEKIKKRFFSGLQNRLFVLATVGFLTLGSDWARGLARQLEIPDKKGTFAEFILEREMTDNNLRDFKGTVEKEEPQFVEFAEEYKKVVVAELSNLEMEIAKYNVNGSASQEEDRRLIERQRQEREKRIYKPDVAKIIGIDHQIISFLQLKNDFLKNSHEVLKKNLDDIFWGIAFLNNSRDARDTMVKFVRPPTVIFRPHNSSQFRATTISSFYPAVSGNKAKIDARAQWHPEITVYPTAFLGGPDAGVNMHTYISVLIHEFNHAALAGSGRGKKIDLKKEGMDFAIVLNEGRTQGLTYKVIRYLNRHNQEIKPVWGEFGEYDQNLVIAEIIESIAQTHSNSDFLIEWQMGILDHKRMLDHLQTTLNDMGLNEDIPKLLANFKFDYDRVGSSLNLLADLLIKLKLDNINLSHGLIRSILLREKEKSPDGTAKVDEWTYRLSNIISKKLRDARY